MTDVARVAGVSQKTVSRVVNGSAHVRDDVRRKVLSAIEELGFRPNAAARALASQRSGAVGIITPATTLYGPSAQLLGLEQAAWNAGLSVVIVSVQDGSLAGFGSAVRRLLDSGVDGLLIGSTIFDVDLTPEVLDGVPAIVIGDPPPAGLPIPAVITDQHLGARAATEHLLALGHRTVHHISGPSAWYAARARQDAWRSSLEQAGAAVPELVEGDWTARSGYQAARRLLQQHGASSVTAVFAANDSMAIGTLRALAEAGRRVPEDVCVVGFDDVPESEYLPVPLSTVRQDFTGMTSRAVTELARAIAGERVPDQIPSEPQLVVRASSSPAPSTTRQSDR
jgi:DNA-binding LacI/PurR family transcriptional regulator